MRKAIRPEEVFLDRIKVLIKNLLLDNRNYQGSYYSDRGFTKLLEDTKERAQYILDEIDRTDHLIKHEENATRSNQSGN